MMVKNLIILLLFQAIWSQSNGQNQLDHYGGGFVNFHNSSVVLDKQDSLALDLMINRISEIGVDKIIQITFQISYDTTIYPMDNCLFFDRLTISRTYIQNKLNITQRKFYFQDVSSQEYIKEYGNFYIRILPIIGKEKIQ